MTDDFRLLLDFRTNNCNMYVQYIKVFISCMTSTSKSHVRLSYTVTRAIQSAFP